MVAQDSQDVNLTPTPPGKTNRGKPKPKRRPCAQLQGVQAVQDAEEEESSDHNDAAYVQAKKLIAERKAKNVNRVRDLEAKVKCMEQQRMELEVSHKQCKEAMEARQDAIESSFSILDKDIKRLPTSATVQGIVHAERQAREEAVNEVVSNIPAQVTASINTSLVGFQNTIMESALAKNTAPITKRMEEFEASLNAEKDSLVSLNLQLSQRPGTEDLQGWIADVVDKKATETDRRILTNLTTQLDTQMEKGTSDLEKIAIPRALEPLKQKIDVLSAICTSNETKVLAATRLQQKHGRDHEQRYKELRHTQKSHTAEFEHLSKEIKALRQDLRAERQKSADLQTARNKDKDLLRGAIDNLRNELRAEREERRKVQKAIESNLHRIQDIEERCSVAKGKEDAFDTRLKQLGAQTAAKLLNLEQNSRRQLKEHEETVKVNTAIAEGDLQSKMEQQKLQIMSQFGDILNANNITNLRNRLEQLEIASSQQQRDHNSEVTNIRAELLFLRKTVVDLAATASSFSKYVDSIIPMSIDLAYLTDQHRDHVANCKADILEQANIVETQLKRLGTELKGRIQDQELALQGHLLEKHNVTDTTVSP
ncbi:hypothetical protein SVAN01_03481 [Stagonosporopsis vannaccii]|nr:hypothetical protein SVAN01_03481 [Stagonosporopsis vannaccii]